MDLLQNRYWPFDTLPPEKQTDHHRTVIRFLETAYQAGFRPYTVDAGSFGATTCERYGLIVVRTQSFWELRLGAGACEDALTAYIRSFEIAADAVLRWLRKETVEDILEFLSPYITPRGGLSSGYRLSESVKV